jgi:hypothetical protein
MVKSLFVQSKGNMLVSQAGVSLSRGVHVHITSHTGLGQGRGPQKRRHGCKGCGVPGVGVWWDQTNGGMGQVTDGFGDVMVFLAAIQPLTFVL